MKKLKKRNMRQPLDFRTKKKIRRWIRRGRVGKRGGERRRGRGE